MISMVFARTLTARIVVWFMVPIICGAVFGLIYWPRLRGNDAEASLEQSSLMIVQTLTHHFNPDLGNPKLLQIQLDESISDAAGVLGVFVRDPAGATVLSSVAKGRSDITASGVPAGEHRYVASQLHVAVPLLSGSVELVVAADRVDELRNEAQWQIVIVVVILVVVATLTCWFLARRLAKPLHDAARSLEALSNELVTSAREQEASTGQSATAIGETRRMMETVVNTAQEISTNCAAVLSNAEHTLSGNRAIAERISELSSQSERVAEILAGVMKVADRTDLLALNAGLEGAKAGEAGKGFALVATEMRRLAETTMQSVQNINGLISEVRERAQAATEASSRGMRFSEDTAESARAIARTTQAQRHATEQVGTSMDEMSELLRHNLNNIQTTARTATEVGLVAQSLTQVVDRRTAVQAAASSSPPLNG